MLDLFVILAPILLLAVVALLGFVGCNQVYGIEPTKPYPTPTVTGLDPSSATVCGPGFSLQVTGTDFYNSVVGKVLWNGSERATTFDSDTQLTVDIPATDIETRGEAQVTVVNDTMSSTPLPFDVALGTPNVVVFDPQPPQVATSGDFLNGVYNNIDFGTGQWRWEFRPTGSVIYFANPAGAFFSFANGKRLLANLTVYATADGQITLTDGTNPDLVLPLTALTRFQIVPTPWETGANMVTVAFSAGAQLSIVQMEYYGPP
jgi:IPT/TIG domain